ncbi:hypothetical protein BT96DRAFT_1013149 [Gymnopus androsaceus JB14]|uniref:Mug135-like C-terminal domain-containing protein n=1 Tax=Gymnopus androsaceus JB14 TaxID=1447944 RepID=A0A6A4IG98_9AGAR|nr:hypothetical protein BT96DRAFT_1013149 [Gymnopus androsaceus JB14]
MPLRALPPSTSDPSDAEDSKALAPAEVAAPAPILLGAAYFMTQTYTLLADIINRLDTIMTKFDDRSRDIMTKMDDMSRNIAISSNVRKGTGFTIPYTEVGFIDGSLPSQAVPGRAALPVIRTVEDLRNLSGAHCSAYIIGYGGKPPRVILRRRQELAKMIGCIVFNT